MWFRRSPLAGAATLIAFLTALALPWARASHHALGADGDAGRSEAAAAVGHPVTQVEIVRAFDGAEHCAVCQWARTLSHALAGPQAWHQPDLVPVLPPLVAASTPAAGLTDSRAPRGPPSAV